jgi:hypothetical protein
MPQRFLAAAKKNESNFVYMLQARDKSNIDGKNVWLIRGRVRILGQEVFMMQEWLSKMCLHDTSILEVTEIYGDPLCPVNEGRKMYVWRMGDVKVFDPPLAVRKQRGPARWCYFDWADVLEFVQGSGVKATDNDDPAIAVATVREVQVAGSEMGRCVDGDGRKWWV